MPDETESSESPPMPRLLVEVRARFRAPSGPYYLWARLFQQGSRCYCHVAHRLADPTARWSAPATVGWDTESDDFHENHDGTELVGERSFFELPELVRDHLRFRLRRKLG
jgi:hypothetical protein